MSLVMDANHPHEMVKPDLAAPAKTYESTEEDVKDIRSRSVYQRKVAIFEELAKSPFQWRLNGHFQIESTQINTMRISSFRT